MRDRRRVGRGVAGRLSLSGDGVRACAGIRNAIESRVAARMHQRLCVPRLEEWKKNILFLAHLVGYNGSRGSALPNRPHSFFHPYARIPIGLV